MSDNETQYITVKDVMKLSGKSERTVRLWLKLGKLKYEKNTLGRIRIERKSVLDLLNYTPVGDEDKR